MKKLKANAVLTTFIFGFSILLLSVFGVDCANIVVTRNRLQQVSEFVALEYAARAARGIDGEFTRTDADEDEISNDIIEHYEQYYGTLGSGLVNFEIIDNNIQMGANPKDGAVVMVQTSSNVLPVFLSFIGINEILVRANAYARTGRIEADCTIAERAISCDIDLSDTPITAKNMGFDGEANIQNIGDFSVNGNGMGFFIFGSFTNDGNPQRFADLGALALNDGTKNAAGANAFGNYTCINSLEGTNNEVAFDLAQNENLQRINFIRIYRAGTVDAAAGLNNPCTNNQTDWAEQNFEFTILNNVSLITRDEYNEFINGL